MDTPVRLSIDGPLARITLDRPPLNVLTIAMLDDLSAHLERVAGDRAVRVVRLDAVGKVFSAGVDVADHVGDKVRAMMDCLVRLFDAFDRVPQPVVAAVHGAALGGGCEVALGADLRWASERASFGQPEIRLGLFAPPASVLLPRLIGEGRALQILLTGETVPAGEAERAGLVQAVIDEDRYEEEIDARFARLLELSGEALRQAKRAVRAARHLGAGEAHRELHRIYLDELMRTEDAAEGLASFLEKRKPSWSHR